MMLSDMIPTNANTIIGLDHRQAIFIKRLQGRSAAIDVIKNSDIPRHSLVPKATYDRPIQFQTTLRASQPNHSNPPDAIDPGPERAHPPKQKSSQNCGGLGWRQMVHFQRRKHMSA